jgi:hypothetical protein
MWLNQYYNKIQLDSFVSREHLKEMTSIRPETWNQWERCTLNMLMLRTNALKLLERTEFYIYDLFPNALGSDNIMSRRLQPHNQFYQRKDLSFQFLQNPTTTLKHSKSLPLFTPGTVWLNGQRGPALDGWSVYQNKTEQNSQSFTIIFLQCKHTALNTTLYTKEIIDSYNKLQTMWNDMVKESSDLNNYNIVLAIVSNRKLGKNHVCEHNDVFYHPYISIRHILFIIRYINYFSSY